MNSGTDRLGGVLVFKRGLHRTICIVMLFLRRCQHRPTRDGEESNNQPRKGSIFNNLTVNEEPRLQFRINYLNKHLIMIQRSNKLIIEKCSAMSSRVQKNLRTGDAITHFKHTEGNGGEKNMSAI